MRTYVYRDGRMVDKETGEPMNKDNDWVPATPMVIGDIEPFLSPVTGKYIGGRRSKRDDLKAHGCVDADDVGRSLNGKIKNERFAKKRGLKVSEEFK